MIRTQESGKSMRIITATGFYPAERAGGAEHQTLLLAQGLAKSGLDVVFLATNSGKEREFKVGRIIVREIPGRHIVGWMRHNKLVAKAIQEIAPDICYVRFFEEIATIMSPCIQAGVPIVSMSVHWMQTSPAVGG